MHLPHGQVLLCNYFSCVSAEKSALHTMRCPGGLGLGSMQPCCPRVDRCSVTFHSQRGQGRPNFPARFTHQDAVRSESNPVYFAPTPLSLLRLPWFVLPRSRLSRASSTGYLNNKNVFCATKSPVYCLRAELGLFLPELCGVSRSPSLPTLSTQLLQYRASDASFPSK